MRALVFDDKQAVIFELRHEVGIKFVRRRRQPERIPMAHHVAYPESHLGQGVEGLSAPEFLTVVRAVKSRHCMGAQKMFDGLPVSTIATFSLIHAVPEDKCGLKRDLGLGSVRLLVESLNDALNGVDFALLEVRLTTLVTDPGRDYVEYQVIAVAVDVEGCLRALHLSLAVETVHMLFARMGDEYSAIRRLFAPPALSGTGRPYLFGYFCAAVAFDQGHVVLTLEFEPETRTVAEIAAKPHRGLGCD